jgi:hypothetical protein
MNKRTVVDIGEAKEVLVLGEARASVSISVLQETHPDLPFFLSPLHHPCARMQVGMCVLLRNSFSQVALPA